MRAVPSLESIKSTQSLASESGTSYSLLTAGPVVPSSTAIRLAQLLHLIPKSQLVNLHDLKKAYRYQIKSVSRLDDTYKKFSKNAEDMTHQFDEYGYELGIWLREYSSALSASYSKVSLTSIDSMQQLIELCDANRSLEPTYRQSLKSCAKAERRLGRMNIKQIASTQPVGIKLADAQREYDRELISLSVCREQYENENCKCGLKVCYIFVKQVEATANILVDAMHELAGHHQNSQLVPEEMRGCSDFDESSMLYSVSPVPKPRPRDLLNGFKESSPQEAQFQAQFQRHVDLSETTVNVGDETVIVHRGSDSHAAIASAAVEPLCWSRVHNSTPDMSRAASSVGSASSSSGEQRWN